LRVFFYNEFSLHFYAPFGTQNSFSIRKMNNYYLK